MDISIVKDPRILQAVIVCLILLIYLVCIIALFKRRSPGTVSDLYYLDPYNADRRFHKRTLLLFPVKFSLSSKEKSKTIYEGSTKDVSHGGMLLKSTMYIDPGTALTVYLTDAKKKTIKPINGRVVRARQLEKSDIYEMGVRFSDDLTFEQHAQIETLISHFGI